MAGQRQALLLPISVDIQYIVRQQRVDYSGLRLVVSESRGPRVEQVTVIRRRAESG